jgi:hypothetical protein
MKKLMSEVHASRAKACMDKSMACAKKERMAAAKEADKPLTGTVKKATPKKRKGFFAIAGAAVIGGGLFAGATEPAEAHWRHTTNGTAGAALALGLMDAFAGAAIASQSYGYGYGYPYAPQYACSWQQTASYNQWGQYIGWHWESQCP